MPIATKLIDVYRFSDLAQLATHFENEEKTVSYLPVNDYIKQNSIFVE